MEFLFYLKLCGLAAMGLVAALVFRRGLAECHERVARRVTGGTGTPSKTRLN